MAEIELSVLNRQCLDRRISDKDVLTEEVAAWEKRRNQNSSPVSEFDIKLLVRVGSREQREGTSVYN